jgi:GT2 family glycosyltransferase
MRSVNTNTPIPPCSDAIRGAAAPVSVVVIGRNEGERLSRCLESVRRAACAIGGVELVYVDSDSTDDSRERAARGGAIVRRVRPARPCAAVGRNAGWRVARGELVLFLDGDTVLDPGFLPAAIAAMRDPAAAVVWGHRREMAPEQSWFVRALDLDWVYAPGIVAFCGGDALVRRAVLEATGGFDETLIAGEEPELCQRIRAAGHAILHIDSPMTLHDLGIRSLRAWWRRAFRAGHAYAEVSQRTAAAGRPLWIAETRRNLVHGSAVAAAPLALAATLGAGPLPFAALALAGLGVLARTYRRCAWKSGSRLTRALYALHSHAQQVPILCGQLAYRLDRRLGRRRSLIEYRAEAR